MVQWWFWMAFSIAISTQSFVKWRLPQGPLYQCQRGGPGCWKNHQTWQVMTANVDTKTGFNHVYENIYYEVGKSAIAPKWSHTYINEDHELLRLEMKSDSHALWICGHAPFDFQWLCSSIMGSAKLSRPSGRCAEAWRLSHVWHTHRHFCHRRMGDLYSFVLRNITTMTCCHTVMLFQVCFILFHGMCMHFVHGWACKEALLFCAWNTSN